MFAESSDNRKILYAVVASLLLHLLIVVVMGVGSYLLERAVPPEHEKRKERLELTILPPEPPPKVIEQERVFARTPDELLANKDPERADFESDKSTLAASELPATGSALVPSQEGISLPGINLENTPYTPGEEPRPSTPSLPSRQRLAVAPRPTPANKQSEPTPPPTPTPLPDTVAVLPPTPSPTPTPKKDEPEDSELPKPPTVESPLSKPGYQPLVERNKVEGSIDSRGRSSVNALGTPLGRYQKAISDAIGSRWNLYIQPRTDRINIGTARVKFYVNSDGSVKGLRVMSNTSNDEFATYTVQAVMEAEIPPIPQEVAKTLEQNRLEVEYTFTVYGGR